MLKTSPRFKRNLQTNRVGDVVHQDTSEKNVTEPKIKPVKNAERKDILKQCVTAKLQVQSLESTK